MIISTNDMNHNESDNEGKLGGEIYTKTKLY